MNIWTHTVEDTRGNLHGVGIYKVFGAYLIVTNQGAWFKFTLNGAVSTYSVWLTKIGAA